jgi:hypothetical protein
MRKYRIGFMSILATMLVVFVAGCGQETVTLPSVVSVTPAQGSANIAVSTTITATFSQAMSAASISATTFTVAAQGGAAVTGTVAYSGGVATFTPGAALANSTTYTATITTGAATPGGAELIGPYVWSFTTGAPTALTVAVTPTPFANPVTLAAPITATFSQAMNCATLSSPATTFTVTAPGDVAVAGSVTCVGSVATFTPTGGALPSYSTTYTATITTGANDVAGFPLSGGNYVWTFTTLTPPPVITPAPTVISTIPLNGATGVATNLQIISAAFSEPMDPSTIASANFMLTYLVGSTITPVTGGTVAYAAVGNELVFVLPASTPLLPSTTYTATIANGVQDLAFTALNGGIACATSTAGNCVWTFQTGTTSVTTPPELVSTVPGDTAPGVEDTNVCTNQAVSATFNEAMNPLTLNSGTFLLYTGTASSGTPIAGKYSYDQANFIATFTPTNPLTLNTSYTATVTAGATDVANNPLGSTVPSPYTNPWTFKTVTSACAPPVTLGPAVLPFGNISGGAGMVNVGTSTVVNGDLGTTSTAASSLTGFHDDSVLLLVGGYEACSYTETTLDIGLVTGTIYSPLIPSSTFCPLEGTAADIAVADEALAEANTAYLTLQSNTATSNPGSAVQGTTLSPLELGGLTMTPGVYYSATTVGITAGDLTLDAQGDPNATWVFQVGSALTVGLAGQPRNVILKNGAKASNVFWVCGSSATINGIVGGGTFVGTVIAYEAITVSTGGQATITTIDGRLISLNAVTTIDNTIINVPAP